MALYCGGCGEEYEVSIYPYSHYYTEHGTLKSGRNPRQHQCNAGCSTTKRSFYTKCELKKVQAAKAAGKRTCIPFKFYLYEELNEELKGNCYCEECKM